MIALWFGVCMGVATAGANGYLSPAYWRNRKPSR